MCKRRLLCAFSNHIAACHTSRELVTCKNLQVMLLRNLFSNPDLRPVALRACQNHRSCTHGLSTCKHSMFYFRKDSGACLICYVYSQGAFAGASRNHKGTGKPHQCTPKRIPLIPEGALMHCCRQDSPPVYLRTYRDQHQTQLDKQERAASLLETQCHT